MSWTRRMARDLREEAKRLREIGLNSIATERDKQAEMWEGIADKVAEDQTE